MHLTHDRQPATGGAPGRTARRHQRGAGSRAPRAVLRLAGLPPHRRHLTIAAGAAVNRAHRPVAGQLVVRWERRPDTTILWLRGALDRATATLLDRELDAKPIATERLLLDLTGLNFIDARGMVNLVRIHERAREHGDMLSFRHGPHVAQRPLGLIRAAQLRSEWATRPAAVTGENSYLALALACADVDHLRPGDRPGAA